MVEDIISRARKQKGLSQESLADLSGLSLRTIQRIEKGTCKPRPYTLKSLAVTLDLEMQELVPQDQYSRQNTNMVNIAIKEINLSCLLLFFIPFLNILLPFILWQKHKHLEKTRVLGFKIITFQFLLATTLIFIIWLMPLLSYMLFSASKVGHFPTTLMIYLCYLVINLCCIIRLAFQLDKDDSRILPFIPNFM